MKHFLTGALAIVVLANLAVGYFNIRMLYNQQHFVFLKADAACNLVDHQTSEYLEVTADFPAPLPTRKGK
jgi:hypothetical protein